MKIGAKITIYSCVAAVISAAVMAVITTVIFMNYVTTLQKKETSTGVKVLESEITAEVSDLEGLCRLLVAQTEGSSILMERMWDKVAEDGRSGAYITGDTVVWQSVGFPFGTEIAKSQSGLVSKDGKLIAVNVYIDDAGTYVVCSELGAPHFVDDVKEKTGAELTLFLDNIRYNTTLLNSSGKRNIGTEMSEVIWESVRSGEVYIGKAEINGVNYYVNYTPLNDVNGNTVGAYFAGYSTAEADKGVWGLQQDVATLSKIGGARTRRPKGQRVQEFSPNIFDGSMPSKMKKECSPFCSVINECVCIAIYSEKKALSEENSASKMSQKLKKHPLSPPQKICYN